MQLPDLFGEGPCKHERAFFARATLHIGLACPSCGWVTAQVYGKTWLPVNHAALASIDIEKLPVLAGELRQCAGPCKRVTACEDHHIAPRRYFGEACEQWPKVPLCRACHVLWHNTVTSKRRNEDAAAY